MGWTVTNKPKGMSLKQFFSTEFDYSNTESGKSGKVLDCAAHLNAAYIAYEINKADTCLPKHRQTREVIAIVCAIRYYRDSYYNFGYKDMDETMGPCYYDCPQKILNLLTPTNNESALEWRRKCHSNNDKQTRRPKLQVGQIIEFERPIVFQSGEERRTFKVTSLKPLRFVNEYGRMQYKILRSTLREIPYKLMA